MYGPCEHRERIFERAASCQRLCRSCYAQFRREERERMQEEIGELAAEVNYLRKQPMLDKPFLRQLLQLCHPDRHGGSELSHSVTQRLLTLIKN